MQVLRQKKHVSYRSKCPANGRNCHRYGKPNHFQTVCRLRKNTERSTHTAATAAVEDVELLSDSGKSVFKVEHVGAVQHNRKGQYFVLLAFLNDNVDFNIPCQLDTGATCNVITHRDVCCIQQTDKPILQASKTKLKFYDGSVAHVLGEYNAKCKYKKKYTTAALR